MSKTIKKCIVCDRKYRPDPRTAKMQKACSRQYCRAERIRRRNANWLKRHPLYGKSRRLKIRAWAKAYPDYWRAYRAAYPEYRLREMRRMSAKRREARRVAKQTAIRRIAVEKLNALREVGRSNVAKQTKMAPRLKAGDTKEDENDRCSQPGRFGQNPGADRNRLPKKLPP